ncbi:AMP-binding protein, partial [candidate division GN15 bacterium]|nr:AMP-binding protein [candidate division GN15 bacterium]
MIRTPDPLTTNAEAEPERPFLVLPDQSITYGDLYGTVAKLAAVLGMDGVKESDRVALQGLSPRDTIECILALWRLKAVACPLSDKLTPGQTGEYNRWLGVSRTLREIPLADGSVLPVTGDGWSLDREATVMLTSGTTGRPRAALHTLGAHYYSASGSAQNIALESLDRWLLALPLYHVGGLAILVRCLVAGASIAVPAADWTLSETVAEMRPTHLSLVPTQLYRLLQDDTVLPYLKSARAILVGGGPLSASLVAQAKDLNLRMATSYGLTEMASQVCTTSLGATEQWHTAGRVLPYRELMIADDGEILVRGECLFRRLIDESGPVIDAIDSDGWYHTGDCGHFDTDDNLVVSGRIDNMFVSGGENIHPEQIEAALGRIDGVEQAVVVSMPDKEFG